MLYKNPFELVVHYSHVRNDKVLPLALSVTLICEIQLKVSAALSSAPPPP